MLGTILLLISFLYVLPAYFNANLGVEMRAVLMFPSCDVKLISVLLPRRIVHVFYTLLLYMLTIKVLIVV